MVASIVEGDPARKEADLWLSCKEKYIESKSNLYLQSNVAFIFDSFSEERGWTADTLDDFNERESVNKIPP